MTNLPIRGRRPYSVSPSDHADLPFRVRLARSEADLARVLALRSAAYSRHVAGMAQAFLQAEEDDSREDALIFMAEHKETGEVIGSLRLIRNRIAPLRVEDETTLPPMFRGKHLAEARRLTVAAGEQGRVVSPALSKVLYETCFALGVDHLLITARTPVDRFYRMMRFEDALGGQVLQLPDVGNIPHRLLYLPIQDADAIWRESHCPLYPFMARTVHPDIMVCAEDVPLMHNPFFAATALATS